MAVYTNFEIPAKYSVQKFSGIHISYTMHYIIDKTSTVQASIIYNCIKIVGDRSSIKENIGYRAVENLQFVFLFFFWGGVENIHNLVACKIKQYQDPGTIIQFPSHSSLENK